MTQLPTDHPVYEHLIKGAVPVLPRHRVYLWAISDNHERFVQLFQDTWKRLPLFVRRRLLKHWRTGESFPVVHSPCLELWDYVENRYDENDEAGVMASVFAKGHKIEFSKVQLYAMGEDEAHFTIAHELAHVLQHASGLDFGEYGTNAWVYESIEREANELADTWGFEYDETKAEEWRDRLTPNWRAGRTWLIA